MRIVGKHLLASWRPLILAGAVFGLATYYGPGHWYVLHSVHVEDGPEFDAMQVTVDRQILRPFFGSFDLSVWPEDRSAPVCHGTGAFPYSRPNGRTVQKTMGWWAGDQRPPCDDEMPPGAYIAETCVTISPDEWWLWWMPPPRTCVWSNVFRKVAP